MDWERWHYGPVGDDEVQQISFQLLTGGAALDPDMHWAFGLRGASSLRPCPVSSAPQFIYGCPLGRGIAIGYFPDGFGSGGHGSSLRRIASAGCYPRSLGGHAPGAPGAIPGRRSRRCHQPLLKML